MLFPYFRNTFILFDTSKVLIYMEREFVAKIIENYRITIPEWVRNVENLKKGDYVRVRFLGKEEAEK